MNGLSREYRSLVSSDLLAGTNLLAHAQWFLASTQPGSCASPDELPSEIEWIQAVVPGTVASVVERPDQDAVDWWFRTTVPVRGAGATTLTFDGIATHSRVWVNGIESARSTSMFVPISVDIAEGAAEVDIVVRIESMDAQLKGRRPRGRWRSSLIAQQGLRHHRTTMLGRAPVYGPLPAPVGLWRPVALRERSPLRDVRIHTEVAGADGTVWVRATLDAAASSAVVKVGDLSFPLPVDAAVTDAVLVDARVSIPDVVLWWPHTHGVPTVYPWSLEVDGLRVASGSVGFRAVELARSGGAVTLKVNGVRAFARGGCWVPLDPIRLWVDAEQLRAELERFRDAGLNMIRVLGTLVYEQSEFWSLCAELGILVWQDVMFATTDPPEDDEYRLAVEHELAALTRLVGGNPALAVVSGGSETEQQPTMLGVPADQHRITLLQKVIPEFFEHELPGTPYVTSSPSSTTGELHTHVGDGIAHYFGVGGYLRPLSDVHTARVRFAAECLAFSIPPERRSVERMFGSANIAGHHPDWKASVPRDRGSSWDFEDVRDHYVRSIFGVDPHLTRRDDAELYLDYGRAAVCEAVTTSYMHWRRKDSECTGALVLTLRDLVPGAGWGLLDSTGAPKAPWYSLARMSQPVGLFFADDGLDGLTVELVDDTPNLVSGTLSITLYGLSGVVGDVHEHGVQLEPHSAQSISVDRIVGTFADINHAYRFGVQTYVAVTAELVDGAGRTIAEATHLVGDQQSRQNDVGLTAVAELTEPGMWSLTVSTRWAAHYVCIDVDGFTVSDSWFHLAPGATRTLTLRGAKATVSGHVRALNSIRRASIQIESQLES